MAFMAVLESDLRALSVEARRRYPAVKDGAEHAILKLRSLSRPTEIAHNEDILRIFLMACEVKSVKLSVIGLSSLQKLISHDAVSPSALTEILSMLKEHADVADESVQLKTLQTILIIFQSRLVPESEENMAQALNISLQLFESSRSSDSVRNTAAATFRQVVALIFDHMVSSESLPAGKLSSGVHIPRTGSVTDDVNRNITHSESVEYALVTGGPSLMRETLTRVGHLGLRLLEDLTALAAGGCGQWLRLCAVPRTFALDILEFILYNYVAVFRTLVSYQQVLRHQICSLLMTSLRIDAELEGEVGEPSYRRLVLRSVSHVIRLYSSSLITECEVFLSMLVRSTSLDLPLWHKILVLEVLRGFCVEARTMQVLFQNFDMQPKSTNIVEGMVKALAQVVSSVQVQETSEESLGAVAGMFSSKANGIEWSLDNDASNSAVMLASEAHAITLAIEGLLGVVFTVATLTDEAVLVGELDSPRCDSEPVVKCAGKLASLCIAMVDSMWLTILDALSLILTRSQGEAIVLEILKGYQAFTQACGVLRALEPLNSFLASLCKFTICIPSDAERRSALPSPGIKRPDAFVDQRDNIVLTPKNVQALRTLFNIAHRLHNVLGQSWVLVLETLSVLDRAIHSPHATTQEVSTAVPKLTRELSGQYTDFDILSSLNSQLFESSALMHISAVKSLLKALRELSYQYLSGSTSGVGQSSSQKIGGVSFSVERMISVLVNNLHRVEPIWDQVVGHFLELADNSDHHFRLMALDALDRSICALLASEEFQNNALSKPDDLSHEVELRSRECAVMSPLRVLYFTTHSSDGHAGSLKILLHVLERHAEKLHYSWPDILEMLRSVADVSEKELVTLGFQCLRVIMNDGLSTIPANCIHVCIDVTGSYSAQKTELNISLTAIGLLWTTADFITKGPIHNQALENETAPIQLNGEVMNEQALECSFKKHEQSSSMTAVERDRLLFSVFTLLQKLGADERPEVRNAAVRTLFQTLGSHGQKLSRSMWEDCLGNYVFPTLERASHMAATSSKDKSEGKELGTRGGKAVHMLIHHSRNTVQKQWDETLVLVLGGISRILRSFFPFIRHLDSFASGWESLLMFVENSIINCSKEVALAALNCLQTTVISHSPKGNLPLEYLKSVLDIYELVLQKLPNYIGSAVSKVKQEILHSLGDLYVQAKNMFDAGMYTQMLDIVHLESKKSMSNNSTEVDGYIPPVQRTILEILPQLCPSENLSSMWFVFLQELLKYLPISDSSSEVEGLEAEQASRQKGTSSNSGTTTADGFQNYLFVEKLLVVLIELFMQAPPVEKHNLFPDIVQGLGRCMTVRRDCPDVALWRIAVEGFNRIIVDDVKSIGFYQIDPKITRPARLRFWKEVADIYEIFLLGYCGRALPPNSLSVVILEADESLELTILDILGDKILKADIDAPAEILQRFIVTLDRCASRTCSLPVETVELMPSHCSRFSLTCLQKLFSFSSCTSKITEWNSTRSEVSKISIMVLMTRCDYIISRYLIDENELGERPLPTARLEELIYVLQELARLAMHPETVSMLPLHPYLKAGLSVDINLDRRPHLLILYPTFCELVISREARVRELVQVLLRLVATELALQKLSLE